MDQAAVTRIGSTCCELGEGPYYDPSANTGWWFDIIGKKLIEYRFPDDQTIIHDLPQMTSFVADAGDGRQLLAMEDGLYLREISNGNLSKIVALEENNTGNRTNDGRTHPSGRLWISTMGKAAERQAGAIYLFDGETIRPLFRKITIPNSICFSPDGRTGYFADTALNTIWRVALDPISAEPEGEPEVFLTAKNHPLNGHFDGSVTDAEGVVWNASWGGGSVSGFSPVDGALVATFEVPASKTSCPCFVGDKLDQMLVTTAWEGYGVDERMADPGAGFTYKINGGFRGRPAAPVYLNSRHQKQD